MISSSKSRSRRSFISLGFFIMPKDPCKIKEAFTRFLESKGWTHDGDTFYEMRDPSFKFEPRYDCSACEWHQDCSGSDKWFVIWSNTGGTMIRYIGNPTAVHVAKPNEVIVIDNTRCEHKPPYPYPEGRYFIRSTEVVRKRYRS